MNRLPCSVEKQPGIKGYMGASVTLWQFEGVVQAYRQTKSTRASTSTGGGGFVTPSVA